MQLWMQTQGGKKNQRVPSFVIITAASLRLLFVLGKVFFSVLPTAASKQGGGEFSRHLYKPSSHSSPLLHGTKRPVCFRSGGASRPIWMLLLLPTSAPSQLHGLVPAISGACGEGVGVGGGGWGGSLMCRQPLIK